MPFKKEDSAYYFIDTPDGPLHIHLDHVDKKITRIFLNLAPIGSEMSGMTSALGIILSKFIEKGGEPLDLIKHLASIKGSQVTYFDSTPVESIPQAISIALEKFKTQYE